MASEKCPDCGSTSALERVEMIHEPVGGKVIMYGSRYSMCLKCKITWYGREQMQQQLLHRGRALGRD